MTVKLPSGFVITSDAESKLFRFSKKEFDYYDGIHDEHPNRILPLDVLVTYGVNSRIWTAERVRDIHLGMVEICEPTLSNLAADLDLTSSNSQVESVGSLLASALSVRWVGMAVATKVLHRKRRSLIPMLDSVLLAHYVGKPEIYVGPNKDRTEQECTTAVAKFRDDLLIADPILSTFKSALDSSGFSLTKLRLLEILVWIEKETNGVYRR